MRLQQLRELLMHNALNSCFDFLLRLDKITTSNDNQQRKFLSSSRNRDISFFVDETRSSIDNLEKHIVTSKCFRCSQSIFV